MPLVGLQNQFGAVVFVLARTEDFVAGRDLVGMQHPFTVVTQRRRPAGDATERLDVSYFQIRPVDRGDTVRTCGDENRHQHVVVGVADVIALGLLADHQGAHIQTGHQVGGPEHQGLDPRGGGDSVDVPQAPGVFDLHVDPDTTDRQPMAAFQLGEQQIQRVHMMRVGHLGQHHDLEVWSGGRHHLDHVAVRPRRRPVVDPNSAQLTDPTRRGQRGADPGAGRGLGVRRHRVLEIEEHLVSEQAFGLLDHHGVAARNRETGSAGPIAKVHPQAPTLCSHGADEQGIRGAAGGDGRAGSRW